MSPLQIGFLALVFLVVVGAVLAVAVLARPDVVRQRLRELGGTQEAESSNSRFMEAVMQIAEPVSKLAAPEEGFEKSSIKLRFLHAGIRNPSAPTAFFGLKSLLTLGLPLLAVMANATFDRALSGNSLLMLLLVLAALGYYGPNIALSRKVTQRQREIFENFPDALDLMTVSVEAGLGTESAMVRVAEDLQLKSPALSEELRLVNLELRAGGDRERALRNLALRTGVEEVEGFVSMINQAERFGTSIAASLRIHSEVLRTRRRQKAEEAAAKIGLKLLMPLIFCIFPALMVVLLGPAMIQISKTLLKTAG